MDITWIYPYIDDVKTFTQLASVNKYTYKHYKPYLSRTHIKYNNKWISKLEHTLLMSILNTTKNSYIVYFDIMNRETIIKLYNEILSYHGVYINQVNILQKYKNEHITITLHNNDELCELYIRKKKKHIKKGQLFLDIIFTTSKYGRAWVHKEIYYTFNTNIVEHILESYDDDIYDKYNILNNNLLSDSFRTKYNSHIVNNKSYDDTRIVFIAKKEYKKYLRVISMKIQLVTYDQFGNLTVKQ
jgi:hypothetical protein